VRDPEELKAAVERYYALWNANDKEAWLEHQRSMAPGEPTHEDPVGKPVKRGWDMLEELWDRTITDGEHFPVTIRWMYVCGNEVAAVCSCEGTFRGKSFSIPSVDVHQFYGDTWAVRAYWDINAMGDLPYGAWTSEAGEPLTV
jgi:hypothetical protein